MSQKYLFDSDSLIVAKNIHYSPDFSVAFWDWIIQGNQKSVLFTIDKVINEFKNGRENDFLRKFAEDNEEKISLKTIDSNCLQKYAEVQVWANSVWTIGKKSGKTTKALEVFAKETMADPWLVAYASLNGFCIVSNEKSAPESQTSIKLPDVANAFGVKVVKLHEVLSIHAGQNFIFKNSKTTNNNV